MATYCKEKILLLFDAVKDFSNKPKIQVKPQVNQNQSFASHNLRTKLKRLDETIALIEKVRRFHMKEQFTVSKYKSLKLEITNHCRNQSSEMLEDLEDESKTELERKRELFMLLMKHAPRKLTRKEMEMLGFFEVNHTSVSAFRIHRGNRVKAPENIQLKINEQGIKFHTSWRAGKDRIKLKVDLKDLPVIEFKNSLTQEDYEAWADLKTLTKTETWNYWLYAFEVHSFALYDLRTYIERCLAIAKEDLTPIIEKIFRDNALKTDRDDDREYITMSFQKFVEEITREIGAEPTKIITEKDTYKGVPYEVFYELRIAYDINLEYPITVPKKTDDKGVEKLLDMGRATITLYKDLRA